MKKRILIFTIFTGILATLIGCGEEAVEEIPVEVEMENLDDIEYDNTEVIIDDDFPEDKIITVAVCGEPANSILEKSREDLAKRGYGIKIIKCDDYISPNTMVENNEVLASLCVHEEYLTAYNKSHESNLVMSQKVYFEPMAVYAGTENDISDFSDGATFAVPDNDVSVARALLLLDVVGVIDVKEDCGFQTSVEDIIDNPHNIKIEKRSTDDIAALSKEYSFYIMEMNEAIASGVLQTEAVCIENKTSDMGKMFAIGFVTTSDNADDVKLKLLKDVIDSERVSNLLEKEYRGSVVAF